VWKDGTFSKSQHAEFGVGFEVYASSVTFLQQLTAKKCLKVVKKHYLCQNI
jgi:hypothetical protein